MAEQVAFFLATWRYAKADYPASVSASTADADTFERANELLRSVRGSSAEDAREQAVAALRALGLTPVPSCRSPQDGVHGSVPVQCDFLPCADATHTF